MNRLAVFVHFDKDDMVDDYVLYYLKELKVVANDIIFVTTSSISKSEIDILEKICKNVILRDNIGYDFMSYKIGLDSSDLNIYDEVIICNDSVYGPIYSLKSLFNKMSLKEECDFWGITDSKQFAYHLQSYFIVFKKKAISSVAFKDFWSDVKVLESKNDIIFQYEIGLTQILEQEGLIPKAIITKDISHMMIYIKILKIALFGNFKIAFNELKNFKPTTPINCNITLWFWDDIIKEDKIPFIKVAALRDNALGMRNVKDFKRIINLVSNYPTNMIAKHIFRMKTR